LVKWIRQIETENEAQAQGKSPEFNRFPGSLIRLPRAQEMIQNPAANTKASSCLAIEKLNSRKTTSWNTEVITPKGIKIIMDNSFPCLYINPVTKESLYYLFLSGLILGSGPCIGFCGPVLAGFIAAYKPSLKKALITYFSFSLAKVASYMVLGVLCGIFSGLLKNNLFIGYLNIVNIASGIFILLIGGLTLIFKDPLGSKYCSFLWRGNLSNAGILGMLAGFSPCLPLLGILNYIIIISHSPWEGVSYALVFGLGTIISPVMLMAALSGKLAAIFAGQDRIKRSVRIISGLFLVYLGLRIILERIKY
jgi:sulfite exporter TauE/SafE